MWKETGMDVSTEALRAIETALQIERDGLEFYTQAAKQTSDPRGKRMFQSLARDEAAHLKLFKSVHDSLQEKGTYLSREEVAAASPGEFARPPIFPTGEELQAAEVPERELAALQRGLEAEKASIQFYSEAREAAEDPNARSMYDYLIEQEEGHRTILQGEYDYLAQTGFWFDVQEFTLEGAG
jgi:rubrerythrin